jgi:hypothetical protein
MPKDMRLNASQWCFTICCFTDATINHLSGLHLSNESLYTTYRYVQGYYLKTPCRHRISSLRKLIGPATLSTGAQVYDALLEIQINPFKEFGVDKQTQQFRSMVAQLKEEVKSGVSICQLMKDFPDICGRNPFLIKKHTDTIAVSVSSPLPMSSPPPKSVGNPSGLPWKVYKAWKKGEMHKASHEEWMRRNMVEVLNNAGNPKDLSWKVYKAWLTGSMYKTHWIFF